MIREKVKSKQNALTSNRYGLFFRQLKNSIVYKNDARAKEKNEGTRETPHTETYGPDAKKHAARQNFCSSTQSCQKGHILKCVFINETQKEDSHKITKESERAKQTSAPPPQSV